MSKFFMKLFALTLVLVGVCLFISSDTKVAAVQVGCPGNQYAPPNWGTNAQDGPMDHGFAAVAVHAFYQDNGGNYRPLNVKYHLNSSAQPGFNYGSPPPGVPSSLYPNARIFQMPIPGGGRTDNRWFGTGGTTGDKLYADPQNPIPYCDGWDELGVGTENAVGNRFLLDCQEYDTSGTIHNNRFWIDQITAPDDPAATRYGGHWQIGVSTGGGAIQTRAYPMNSSNNYFGVINGENARVNLEWVPNPPPHNPAITTECNLLDITDGGGATINGKHFESGAIRTAVRVYDSSGQVLVHGPEGQGYFLYFNDTRKVWRPPDYVPRGVTLTIQVYRQYYHNNSGNWQWNDIPNGSTGDNGQPLSGDQTRTHTCYSASCGVLSIDGNVPGRTRDAVISGTQYRVTMFVHNNGPLSLNIPTMNGTAVDNTPLNPGDEGRAAFMLTAPGGGPQNYTVNFTVNDVVPGLTSCPATVAVYQSFTLEPHATLDYKTAENPGPIGYNTYVQNNSAQAISAPSTSSFTSIPYGGGSSCSNVGPVNSNGPYNPGGPNYVIGPSTCSPPSFNAGDQFCTEINLTSFNQGYVGPGGDVKGQSLNGSATDKHCVTVVNEPYFKVYTGGISAGGDFSTNGNCSGGGLLAGWNDNTGGQARGASSQLSALALIKITGVASAQAAAPTSSPPGTGLTFANTANGLTNTRHADSPTLGGNYDSTGGSHCFNDVSPPTNGGDTTSYNSSQTIAGSGAMSVSGNKSIFVNGDVYIAHNITYSGSWAAGSGPSLVLRATGNIYIAPGVTELDGVYIAKHKIYTCGVNSGNNNFAPVNSGSLYGSCNTQLVVYGSFIAQQVNLMRTYGSLRNSTAGEQPTGGSISCSYSGGPGNKASCAGEIFILSPGMYLTNPAISLPNNGAVQYDSITSLPPVL